MKRLLFLCAVLFSITAVHATDPDPETDKIGTISGKVLDATLREPLPYVNIIIKNISGEILTGGITLEDGAFEIRKIIEGNIIVSVQYIGYKTYNKEVHFGKGNYKVNLGNILLEEQVEGLDAVTVVAEVSTIQQKVDRKVITIGKDLAATGTASELMIGIPSVNIDVQSGEISLRGNSNVRVMVDGKISNIPTDQLLQQIPSSAIKSIELITNPSAKYNPEGMSGIINIVLHKNTMIGFNGSASVNLSHEKEAKFNSSLNMNYRNGKFNLYGSYSNNIAKRVNVGNIFRPSNNSEQFFQFLNDRKNHLYKVGVDIYLNDKNTISMFTNRSTSNSGFEGQTDAFFYNNPSFNQSQLFNTMSDNNSEQYNFDYKLDFKKEGHNIELEVDYNNFNDEGPVDYTFLLGSQENYIDFNFTDRTSTTANLDYVNPLSETAKLELGLQARLFNSDVSFASTGETLNEQGLYRPTPNTDFDYTRDIYSAYATYSKKIEKWNYKIGARIENVAVDALAIETEISSNISTPISFKNNYFEIYPSAFLTYSPSDKNSYQLSYSRRVDRPGVEQVNPIKRWSTPLVSQFGNIDLRPQFTNSLEVNYTRNLNNNKGSITGGVFYRAISDEINRALFIDRTDINSGKVIMIRDNFDDTSAYGFELSTNYRPTKWWSINGSFDIFSQTQKGIAERLTAPIETATVSDITTDIKEVDNITWNFRMFNNFKATKALTLTAFAFYKGKEKGLQFNTKPMYFVNLGARYTTMEGKGTFSLSYNDVFNTQRFSATGVQPFEQDVEFNWESNTVQIGFAYRFGGGKYRAKSRKQRDNNEKSGGGGF